LSKTFSVFVYEEIGVKRDLKNNQNIGENWNFIAQYDRPDKSSIGQPTGSHIRLAQNIFHLDKNFLAQKPFVEDGDF
jgi:hypothetical protein